MKLSTRMWSWAGVLVVLCLVLSSVSTLADDETVAAGNGGTGDCAANGGALTAGDVTSGANTGSAVGVGDTWGGVDVNGGALANSTGLSAALGGGTGICDASGADDNIAFTLEPTPVPTSGPITAPPPAPTPTPIPEPQDEAEFQVCVSDGDETVCLPGSCEASQRGFTCTIPADCSIIPGQSTSPCSFPECEVDDNRGNCRVPPP